MLFNGKIAITLMAATATYVETKFNHVDDNLSVPLIEGFVGQIASLFYRILEAHEYCKGKRISDTKDYPAKVHPRTVTNGEGECMFLDKNYKVKFRGCENRADLILSYPK